MYRGSNASERDFGPLARLVAGPYPTHIEQNFLFDRGERGRSGHKEKVGRILTRNPKRARGAVTACMIVVSLTGSPSRAQMPAVDHARAATAPVTIPALTTIELEILSPLSSRTSKTGQVFALRLVQPIVIDGKVIVAAGTPGEGEVLNAKHSSFGGSPGMLMLIARSMTIDGRALRLRSMHIDQSGANHMGAAIATSVVVPLVGLLVQGGETNVAAGTHAMARTAEDFTIAPAPKPDATNGDVQ